MCHADQRDALWEFKSEFHLNGMTASEKTLRWRNNTDCCSWNGITCDPKTGNVAELKLLGSSLNGSLRSKSILFRLQHLQILDLSSNNFAGILPDSIGNLKNLRVLKLIECNLFGKLPSSLGNLSYLTHLYLGGNDFTGELILFSHLMSVSLVHLSASCNISEFPKFLQRQTSLFYLDISNNQIKGQVPEWLWSLPRLGYVDFSRN
ncbi:hypothetical protein BRARA_A02063 [Brassica rapa]|uniref:Leucine-rich repeat-containing N-terminal plant-type domain-containing protein n=1 Tax=Brassica campestris TaxID=3711 RepID=A0A398ANN6_BRACM|nr:hypothetical protein BRARA_A02063 [Brassica rapa]